MFTSYFLRQHVNKTQTGTLLIFIFLFSSCASFRNNLIEKRKYRKGYHIDQADQHKAPEENTAGTNTKQNHSAYQSTDNYAGRNFLSFNILPMESLRLGYSFLVAPNVTAGLEFSLLYKYLIFEKNGPILEKHPAYIYTDYFTLNQNMLLFAPFVKIFLYKPEQSPGSGFYLKGAGNFTSIIDGLKTDYYNKPGIPGKVGTEEFLSMSNGNKTAVIPAQVSTQGFDIVFGFSFYTTDKYRVMIDLAVGYHYLKLPDKIKEDHIINGETFYYHDTPMWTNPLNFPLCTQATVIYRF